MKKIIQNTYNELARFKTLAGWAMIFIFFIATKGSALTWDVPSINSDEIITLEIITKVDLDTGGQVIINVVSHTQDQNDTNDTPDDLTEELVVNNPIIGSAKSSTVDINEVEFIFTLANMGNIDLTNISLIDDLDAVFGNGNYVVNNITSSTGDLHNPGFNGSSNTELANGLFSLATGSTETITLKVTVNNVIDNGNGIGVYQNQVTAIANSPSGQTTIDDSVDGLDPDPDNDGDPTNNSSVTEFKVELAAELFISKQANKSTAEIGDYVTYKIIVENNQIIPSAPFKIFDRLPNGFKYVPNSAYINGIKSDPIINGRLLEWNQPSLSGGGSVILEIQTIIGSAVVLGSNPNLAWIIDQNGKALSTTVNATIEIIADPIYNCSDLIGRVFEDTNKDGYYTRNERGIANVKLYTIEGLKIQTDRYGRYHIACSSIPKERYGSNFIIKVDTDTLPTGFKITSENPRVIRLTQGKMSKINFGAYKNKHVNLKLNDSAFIENSYKFKKKLSTSLVKLIKHNKQDDLTFMVSYDQNSQEDQRLIKQRIAYIKKWLEKHWKYYTVNVSMNVNVRIRRNISR